jgi:hypothetical protein
MNPNRMPRIMMDLIAHVGGTGDVHFQITPGQRLIGAWDNHATIGDGDSIDIRDHIDPNIGVGPSEAPDIFVMTPTVPFTEFMQGKYDAAKDWANLVANNNINAEIYMYETWAGGINSDPVNFRNRLDSDRDEWEQFLTTYNAQKPSGANDMLMLPGGQMQKRLYDDIQNGIGPWTNLATDFFKDSIHPNDAGGWYATAMLWWATIYREDPRTKNFPTRLNGAFGVQLTDVGPTVANYLQQVAWEVAQADPLSGV